MPASFKKFNNTKGQTSFEFILVLPFFLMMVFTVLLFGFRTILGELTLYSVFYSGRVATVASASGNISKAGQSVLSEVSIITAGAGDDILRVSGDYQFHPLIKKSGSENLDSPLANTANIKTGIEFTHFIESTDYSEATDDNPVGGTTITK